jgi:membrane fusion protein (multidrug efflux system)
MAIIATLFIVIGIACASYWLLISRYHEETEDAYVQGNVVQVTPQVQGTVSQILVEDTDSVQAGQPLLTFDNADAELAVSQAEAQLAQTVREVRTLYSTHAQSEANVALRVAELARAQDDYTRRQQLKTTGAVSNEELRHAELAVGVALAAVNAAKEQVASGRALIAGTNVEHHPNVLKAAAHLQEAMLTKSRMTIYAPVSGQIAKRNVQVGQRMNPGTPLMAIVPLDQLWVDANFKEAQLRKVRIGQPVVLTTDLYGSKVVYQGRVIGLAAGTGSAFALLPAQNATGNWIKVVQRLPVRIALDSKELAANPLRIGLSVVASVDLHETANKTGTANRTPPSAALTGAAVNPVESVVKAKVAAIIAANLR